MTFSTRCSVWSKNQKGFSLVEVLVGSAMLSGAIFAGMNYISNMQSSRKVRNTQSMYRYLAIQATQAITTGVAFYPPVDPPTASEQVLYVGCFDGQGVNIPNKKGNRDFQFTVVNAPFNEKTSTDSCNSAIYEVRFYWSNAATKEVLINVLGLNKLGTQDRLTSQNFKVFAK